MKGCFLGKLWKEGASLLSTRALIKQRRCKNMLLGEARVWCGGEGFVFQLGWPHIGIVAVWGGRKEAGMGKTFTETN